jgi:hypothetical protein
MSDLDSGLIRNNTRQLYFLGVLHDWFRIYNHVPRDLVFEIATYYINHESARHYRRNWSPGETELPVPFWPLHNYKSDGKAIDRLALYNRKLVWRMKEEDDFAEELQTLKTNKELAEQDAHRAVRDAEKAESRARAAEAEGLKVMSELMKTIQRSELAKQARDLAAETVTRKRIRAEDLGREEERVKRARRGEVVEREESVSG